MSSTSTRPPSRVSVELDGKTWHPLDHREWPLDALVLLEDGDDGPFLVTVLPPIEAAELAADGLDDDELYALADSLVASLTAR